jgi:intracellular sulfur oxidation DsrE/DsrF family protein
MLEKAVIHPDHVEVCVRADGIDSLVKSLNQQKKRLEEKYE